MRLGRAAKRPPPGSGKRARCTVIKPLEREAAHLTRRDGHRRRLIDHGDGITIEEEGHVGPPAQTFAFTPPL